MNEQPVDRPLPLALVNMTLEERKELERKLVRKLDLRLMVPAIFMYILNYLDRSVRKLAQAPRWGQG